MDDQEKSELIKQKKLVDCVSYLNSVLESFERLENYKARILPIINGFDLSHSDTYLELTENIKRELFYIKFFSKQAAEQLVKYRQSCHPEQDIYSIKEKKNRVRHGLVPIGNFSKRSKEMQHFLNESQKKIDEMLVKRNEEKLDEVNLEDFRDIKDKLNIASEKKRKKQIKRTEIIVKLESKILRLEWAIFLIFLFQIVFFIKISIN
jgi:hypothetical protein